MVLVIVLNGDKHYCLPGATITVFVNFGKGHGLIF